MTPAKPSLGRAWCEARARLTWTEIAREAGVSVSAVKRWFRIEGVKHVEWVNVNGRTVDAWRRMGTNGDAADVRAWLRSRSSVAVADVAAELGVKENTVYRMYRRYGVPLTEEARRPRKVIGCGEDRCHGCDEELGRRPRWAAQRRKCAELEASGGLLPCMPQDGAATGGRAATGGSPYEYEEYEQAFEGKERIAR